MKRIGKSATVRVLGLVTLIAFCWTGWSAVAAKRVESALNAVKTAGLPMSTNALRPTNVPAAENAAFVYLAAFALAQGIATSDEDEELFLESQPTDSARAVLARYAEVFALLRRAAHLPRCAFPRPEGSADAPAYPVFKALLLGRALVSDAAARLAAGDGVGAEEDLDALFALGRAAGSEPSMMPKMVQLALQGIGAVAARGVIRNAADPLATLAKLHLTEPRGAVAEGFRYEVANASELIGADATISVFSMHAYPETNGCPSVLERIRDVLVRPLFRSSCASHLENSVQQSAVHDRPYSDAIPRLEAIAVAAASGGHLFTRPVTLNTGPFLTREATVCAEVRMLQLGARALEHKRAHGDWPKDLAELGSDATTIDPVSDRPFEMRRDGDALVLVSPSDPALMWKL